MGTTKNRLLDLTRLVSRAGRVLTGVDRVEFAYLTHLLAAPEPLFGLVRTGLGYILLDRNGCRALRDHVERGDWGHASALARLAQRRDPLRAAAENTLRKLCIDRCVPFRLHRMLDRHLTGTTTYINTGHSNLTDRVTSAVKALPSARIAVLVHDTIPLDFPQYQRPGTPDRFASFLRRVGRDADLVICNSEQTQTDIARHLGSSLPETVMAHLGVDMPRPSTPPDGPWSGSPYFVTLGTIEPRKNHAFLLDVWQDVPNAHLLICGHRGWNNDAVFAQLDAGPPRVHELPGLPDAAIFGLMQNATGHVFPSLAEGFGLPPVEAAALGVPVLCNDLPIYREVLGDIPIYASVRDRYLWLEQIKRLVDEQQTQENNASRVAKGTKPPSWDAHFKTVLRLI